MSNDLNGSSKSQELWRWQATDLAQAIRLKQISSREAVQACLARTQSVNPALNAIVQVLEDAALHRADECDRAVARGEPLGPLHGVPVTTKINVDQAGLPTTNGIVAQRDNLAQSDSPVVANLRKAGAVIFGRTNTPAFSMRWFTDNALHGRTLNPWSAAHTPGGSSGGASAAVASGMGPIAHGNDLAGSVRYPAYCTGIYGLRPSFGRVPAFLPSASQERPLSVQIMSVQGPLARSVADLRLALEAMSGADPRDPWWVPAPIHGAALARPIKVALTLATGSAKAEPYVEQALRRAARWLSEAGYVVEEIDPPDMEEAVALWDLISRNETLIFSKPLIETLGDPGIQTSFKHQFGKSAPLSMEEHLRAMARRSSLIRNWSMFMERYPLVLGPVSSEAPFLQGLDTASEHSSLAVLAAQGPQFLVPVLGLPALSAPTGFLNGLPLGVQLIGQRFREDLILDAAAVIEARDPCQAPIDPRP
jgi:amidase